MKYIISDIHGCKKEYLQLLDKIQFSAQDHLYILGDVLDRGFDVDGHYLKFDATYEDGLKEGTPFNIKKELFECKKNVEDRQGVFGCVGFCSAGYRNNTFSLYLEAEKDSIEWGDSRRFEYRYVDMPLMFRRKDIVHVIGTEFYGIVDSPLNDEDEIKHRNCAKSGDYSDWQVPANLEYAEFEDGDLRKGMLDYMVKTLYECSWLGGGGRDVGRIQAVLSALETVWRQYPDMRLGQLLINVCGETDLFVIEDEKILERLQYNTFPIRD